MFPVDAGTVARYTPAPATPPPMHVVRPDDTVQSVAQAYQLTPEELARSNGISVDTALTPGQTLSLPPNAVQPAKTDADAAPPPQTPAQKTDAAITRYENALKQRDQAMATAPRNMGLRSEIWEQESDSVDQARQAMDQAIHDEIGGQVAAYNQGVPGQFRTPTDQLITRFGNAILARHQGDAVASTAIATSIGDTQLKAKADSLIPTYGGDWSAADKLKGIDLGGQPPAVVDAVLADPRVKQWMNDAVKEAGGKSTADCLDYFADLAKSLPPAMTAQVMEQWWTSPDFNATEQTIGMSGNAATDPASYQKLAAIYATLGQSPQGQTLQRQIASTIANQQQDNPLFASRTFSDAIQNGADPGLAIAVASQMQANGKTDAATEIVGAVRSGTLGLQKFTLANDMQAYAKQTEELNELIKNLGPALTDQQKQQAIAAYVKAKGTDWQNRFKADQNRIIADVRALNGDLTALSNMPGNLERFNLGQQGLDQIGGDQTTLQAVKFAADQDPGIFEGEQGGEAAKLWVEIGHKDKDVVASIGTAYVAGHVLPAISGLNPNDAGSVAAARQTLEDFRNNGAAMLGVPQAEVDEGVNKLESVLASLKTESLEDAMQGKGINALAATQKELGELKGMTFSNGAAALAFRTIAFGLSGAALLNQTGKTVDDPTAQNILGSLALSVGAAKDAAGFGATVHLLDKHGSLGRWGLGASTAGELTEKFIGVLNIGYYTAGGIEALDKGDVPSAIFDGTGLAGTALATFGGEEILGGLAGPIGLGVVAISTIALGLIEHHHQEQEYNEAANRFLEGAGIEDDGERNALIGAGPDQLGAMLRRGISPAGIQDIAKNEPEAMHIAYGNDPQGRPY